MIRAAIRRYWPQRGSYRREVVESFGTNIVLAGMQVVTGVILARVLGRQGRGELLAIQALPLLVGTFGMLGLQDALIYFGARSPRRIGEYAVSATALIALLGVPIVAIAALLMPWYLEEQSGSVILASQLYLGLLFAHALTTLSITTARAAHDISLWNKLRLVPTVLWVAIILALWGSGTLDPSRLALVYLAVFLVWCVVAVIPTRRYFRESRALKVKLWPPMMRYGLPVAVGATPMVLNQRIDQTIIVGLFAAEDLGLYGVAVSWSMLMMLPGTAMASVAFSKVAGMEDVEGRRRFAGKSLLTLTVISILGVGALALAAPIAIPLIFTEEFRGAVPPAIVLTVAAGLRNLVLLVENLMMGVGLPRVVMIAEWAGFAALFGLIVGLAPRFGLLGAAWSVVGGTAVALVVALALLARWSRSAGSAVEV
jgi:O-antigen/teichoic acid export membrane protein